MPPSTPEPPPALLERVLRLADAEATGRLAAALLHHLPPGALIFLRGELGAGKTTLARGLLRAAGHAGPVRSPTFTLVEDYVLPDRRLCHFDLYRLDDPEELEWMGLRDYLDGTAICLIEWPERGAEVLPPADLDIELRYDPPGRRARLLARAPWARAALAALDRTAADGAGPAPEDRP